jgi:L-asparaginase
MRHITLITTGGTIEKTYDETTGTLENRRSIVGRMLSRLRLEDTRVCCTELMSKDSLLMTDEDRAAVVAAVREAAGSSPPPVGIVILHGTDTLEQTGERLCRELDPCPVPVVLTGAMRPYEMKRSDALQNLTEAVFGAGVLPAGVYCVAHGRALRFPGVTKDRVRRTFTAG